MLGSARLYSLDVALALHRAARIQVMVANPRATKCFGDALLTRGKTDPSDAEVLLKFVERMPFRVWQPPSESALDLRAEEHIRKDDDLNSKYEILFSVGGIGKLSAIKLLGELLVLPEDMSVRQWVAHAGLDPRPHQSGSSINKPARISKRGNQYLRNALYMPSLVAIQREPRVQAFYEDSWEGERRR